MNKFDRQNAAERCAATLAKADAILTMIAAAPSLGGWRPIAEAPVEEGMYLISGRHQSGEPWWNVRYFDRRGWNDYDEIEALPTHFMPLPAPPVPTEDGV